MPVTVVNRSGCTGWTAFLGCLVVVLAVGLVVTIGALVVMVPGGRISFSSGPCVAVVPIEGLITYSGGGGYMSGGGTGMVSVLSQLRRAEKDDSVKAILLWVDSPGGSAAGSEAVYEKLMKLRQVKPVVAAMGDVAASGAYYISSAANKIVAGPATTTGSIGVVFSTVNIYDLMKHYGVSQTTVVSGPHKEMLSPFKPTSPADLALVKTMIMGIYSQFVRNVATARNLPLDKVRKLADGRVYTGLQAKTLGLVDQLGNRDDAVKLAASLGGIQGWPRLKEFVSAPSWLRFLRMEGLARAPWYATVLNNPGPWLTLPVPGVAGLTYFPGAKL